jgi:hypothetical protein
MSVSEGSARQEILHGFYLRAKRKVQDDGVTVGRLSRSTCSRPRPASCRGRGRFTAARCWSIAPFQTNSMADHGRSTPAVQNPDAHPANREDDFWRRRIRYARSLTERAGRAGTVGALTWRVQWATRWHADSRGRCRSDATKTLSANWNTAHAGSSGNTMKGIGHVS